MSEINNNDLNEVFEEVMSDAEVITVPIDDTLSHSNEAADAAAVGAALALKADKSQVSTISVNGQSADNQGHIIVDGTQIEMSSTDDTTLKDAIEEAAGRTGEDIPVDDDPGAQSVTAAIAAAGSRTAQEIRMSSAEGAATISGKIATMDQATADLQTAIQGVSARTGADIPMSSTDSTKVADAIGERLKSVNGIMGDADGDVYLDQVPFADNLRSNQSQNVAGTFTLRTAGGEASIENGEAWLTGIRGNRVHNGYVPESLNMSVEMVEREQGEDVISATIDRDTFVGYVTESGTITLSYTTSWSPSPTLYGVTVTGTPKNGDQIVIVYVKEVRGTIVQAFATESDKTFIATGWNLFNEDAGYARVVKYSDVYGFRVEGTYTALQFSATIDGEKSGITVVDGNFTVPSSGYVWVTGGTSTDTEIYMTWSDWTDSEDHPDFEAYTDTVIDLSNVIATHFPYGLLRAGDVRDEINLNAGIAISNVQRMEYNDENLEYAESTGRVYEYDTNYIYLERATAETAIIELDGGYTVSDHGIEYFTGTGVPVYCTVLYGNNLKNKLERDVLTISQQELSDQQKDQVLQNLGISEIMGTPLGENTDFLTLESGIYTFYSPSYVINGLPSDFPATGTGGRLIVTVTETGARYYILQAFNGRYLYAGGATSAGVFTWVRYDHSGYGIRSVTYTYSVSAGSRANTNLKTLIDADMPSGATFNGIVGFQSGDAGAVISAAFYANNNYSLCVNNVTSSAISSKTATIYYKCI